MPRRILTRGPLRVTRDNRIHLLPQTVMNTAEFSLIIDPVREQDAGEYRCLFQLGSELHHKVVILVVKVPPYFEQRPAKMVRANERDSLRLYCNASGAPQPKIRWWVRLSLPPSPESLNSGSPNQLSDRSRATTRTNSSEKMENSLAIGKELLKPIELILSHYQSDFLTRIFLFKHSRLPAKDPPEILMSNNEIQQHLGGNTIISCTVRAYPSGTVEWELNGVPIHAPYCGYFEVKKLKYCQIEYHKFARDLSSLTGLPLISETKSTETFYTNSDPLPVPGMDPDDHEFYRLSDVRLTVANITHADLGLYTCRVRTSAGVGEGYTRLEAHLEYHKFARDLSSLTGLPLISETKSTETFYTNSDPLPVPGMDPDDHEFYRLSDVRLTVANITHADLGLYTCRVRTSAGVGEGYTRLEAHPDRFNPQYISSDQSVGLWRTSVTPAYRTKSVKSDFQSSSAVLAYSPPRNNADFPVRESIPVQMYTFLLLFFLPDRIILLGI
ncbi:hypothetical protein FBUS_03540 [Fasciolopsis buskii]|uniref:Ig-like domain-containing protein n=1 Tax=Fasciolopsis buskii TaxID=27845 RepID=A0A8E0S2L0_9TREM|nr:hypothetical protein FBUS_03540 [Fasciolopsis buski]